MTAGSRLLPEDNPVRDWMDDSLDTTRQVGQSMVAWDEWSRNPARAAGLVTFNVVTTVATLGTGTAVRATGSAASATARAANVAARIGNAMDPMTYIVRGATAIPRITGLTSGLNAIPTTTLPDGNLVLPDGSVLPPNPTIADLPPGANALRLPDDTVLIPRHDDLADAAGIGRPDAPKPAT